MIKRWIRVFVVLAFSFVLMAQGNGTVEPEVTEKEDVSFISTETESMESDGSILFSDYDCLNDYFQLDIELMNWANQDLIEMGVAVESEKRKGEFTPVVPEDCSFPEELVVIMEDIVYNSASFVERKKDNNYFDVKCRELGSEEFKVKDEDERNEIIELGRANGIWDIVAVYHFSLTGETDNYLLVSSFTGTCGIANIHVYLKEMVGNELVGLHSFETETRGELIQYDGEFYYITWEENDALGGQEGIRIHRLNGNPKEETLCIRFLPDEYNWLRYYSKYDQIYSTDTPEMIAEKDEKSDAINEYLEEVKKEFANGRYLRVDEEDTVEIYYGDEKDGESLEMDDEGSVGYKVDIANCGLPVYVSKEMIWYGLYSEYLKSRFFYYDTVENDFKELENASLKSKQLWFKEIEGKIYRCQIKHIREFNYSFEIVLLEKDGENVEGTMIYWAVLVPQRKFVVTEEPVNVTRLNG